MSVKVCSGVKQADESTNLNALIDEETESKSDAVSDNCTEYSIRNSEHVSDSLMPESASVDEEKEANLANKNDENEEDNDEASLDSNYSNKSNSAVSKTSNDTATMNVPLSSLTTRAQILSNQNEYDESIIIPDDDDDGQDDLPLSQVLSSIKKSKTKGEEQSGDEPTTSGNNTLDESISSVAAGKSASFKEYLLDLKKRSLDQKIARENTKTTLTLLQQQQQLQRKCEVCRRKVPQEQLCEHYTEHFDSSPHCVLCNRVTKSPSLYISHFLSHFPPQFYCFFCDRWFKTPSSYQRHKDGCSNGVGIVGENEVIDEMLEKSQTIEEEREEPPEKKTKLNQSKVSSFNFQVIF